MLAEIAAGVLVNVITATGRWIGTSEMGARGKAAQRDADIAGWFDTYELVGTGFPELPESPGLPTIPEEDVAAWLRRSDVHAVLHELLATRITDAPEADVKRLRGALRRTAAEQFLPAWVSYGMSMYARGMSVGLAAEEAGYGVRRFADRAGWRHALEDAASRFGVSDQIGTVTNAEDRIRPVMEMADRVFDWADGEICELVARFEARDPQRWRAARQDAFGARIVAVLNAIDRHLTALDDWPDPQADADWIELYLRQARPAYGTIEPPDFARRRKVPIGALYVPPDIVEPGAARDAEGNPATIGFDELAGRIDRTVLLGDPGGGKSTASRVLAYGWAQALPVLLSREEARCANCGALQVGRFCEECGAEQPPATGEEPRPSGRSRVPFLVVLRDFATADGPRGSVVEHIEERLNSFHQCAAPHGAVERLLLSGGAVVIFDGLDELIDTGRRVEVTRVVEQFCTRFPLAPVLVTSRLVGYDEARLDDAQFDVYRIAGFTHAETAAYVQNWFDLEDDTDADMVADAFMRESEQVTDLRSNPLMLSLMCILYRGEGSLPRNRPGVYAECAKLLFDKWDTRRGIHVDLQARNLIEPALRHIAYWLFTRTGPPEVTEAEIIARVADLLHERGFEQRHDAEAAASEFVRFCRGRAWILGDAGTTARGEALYTFTHRTFLEYFAAAYLASVTDTPEALAEELAPRVAAGEWDVVGQLAVQIKDASTDRGAERVLASLLADVDGPATFGDRYEAGYQDTELLVAFAARCLDVAEVPPALVRKIANLAVDHLTIQANDALSYLPLWRDRIGDVIADVISERIAELMAADDPDRRRLGAYISVYATFCAAENTNSAYWHRLERRLTTEHRDALVEMARTDDAIWMRLIDRGVITLTEALRLRDEDFVNLFSAAPAPFTGRTWASLIDQVVDAPSTTGIQRADPDAAVDRCQAFGELVREIPPPWRIGELPEAGRGASLAFLGVVIPHEPVGFLGAAMAAALAVEHHEQHPLAVERESTVIPPFPTDGTRELVASLAPYLARRGGDLPDLPIEPRFQDLFRRWARRELDFVQWPHGEPE